MKKGVIFGFLIGIFLLFSILFVSTDFVDDGTLVQNVTDCGILNTTNAVYTLNQSINSSFDCLTINATNITLDCMNYNISFGNSTGGFGIVVSGDGGVTGVNNITIRNCYIMQNESGVNESAIFFGPGSENAIVFNNTIEAYGDETLGIMLENNSVNANISSNNIYTNGTGNAGGTASGIIIADNGINAIIEDNLMAIVGNDSSGIFLMENVSEITVYNNALWIMGNRTISNHAIGGIVLEENTHDLNISSNFIISGGSLSLIGEETDEEVDLTLENWTQAGGGYDTAGIWIWGDNSTIDDNLIISFGELGDGIFLNDVEGINITSNIIVTLGEQGHGIHSDSSENFSLLFYENIIGTFGNNASGIYLNQDSYNNLSLNDISTFGDYSHGVSFNQSSNITFMGNIIEIGESNSYVLYMNVSAGNLIYNNIFNTSTSDSGAFINNSDPSDFNITKTSGTNIVGKSYLGGNYWTNINGTGYSDSCTNLDDDYICDSSYTIIEGKDFIDYLPLALNITTSNTPDSPASPSGSSGYPLFRPTEEELEKGYTQNLFSHWRISFNLENESHIFTVKSVNATSARITLSSELQEAIFFIGQEKRFELSGDNSFDLLVRLNSITLNKAEFTIQRLYEEITSQGEEQNETNQGDLTTKEEKTKKTWLLIIVIIIVLLIGIGLSYKKLFKKKRKN